jgi:acetyl-CoA/propionyl-CoA carboxylase
MSKKITSILIANRGEIALRVIRACKDLGIKSIAIYSDEDVRAVHVKRADEAYHIGPAAPAQSYLNMTKIVETAKAAGADGIHPFLRCAKKMVSSLSGQLAKLWNLLATR